MKTMINEVRNSLPDFLNLFKLKYEKKTGWEKNFSNTRTAEIVYAYPVYDCVLKCWSSNQEG